MALEASYAYFAAGFVTSSAAAALVPSRTDVTAFASAAVVVAVAVCDFLLSAAGVAQACSASIGLWLAVMSFAQLSATMTRSIAGCELLAWPAEPPSLTPVLMTCSYFALYVKEKNFR